MSLFENDLLVIVRLAFPSVKIVIVLDPGKAVIRNYDSGFDFIYTRDQVLAAANEKRKIVLVNISGASSFTFPFDFSNIEGIISFNISYETSVDFYHFELFYVVDQQNALRWILSEKHKETSFLQDYYQYQFVTDVGNFFTGFSSLTNYLHVKFGNLRKVTDGNFQVLKRDKNFFECIDNEQYTSFTIQFKDSLIRGLLRIDVYNNNKLSAVINHAILPSGFNRIENEQMVISEISRKKFRNIAIPDYKTSDYSVCYHLPLAYKPSNHKQTRNLLHNKLIDAINEYQEPYIRQITLKDLWKGNDVLKILTLIRTRISQNQLPRGLSATNVTRLYSKLIDIFNKLDISQPIYVSLNNNSFNNVNIYSANEKLYFTSWGYADFDLPLFSDLFFDETGYIEGPVNPDSEVYTLNINFLITNSALTDIANKYNADIKLYLKLFFVLACTKQFQAIITKKTVLPEVNILVFNWLTIIDKFG
jgi:hypothetical protein